MCELNIIRTIFIKFAFYDFFKKIYGKESMYTVFEDK
jgi:hypothetical protein